MAVVLVLEVVGLVVACMIALQNESEVPPMPGIVIAVVATIPLVVPGAAVAVYSTPKGSFIGFGT